MYYIIRTLQNDGAPNYLNKTLKNENQIPLFIAKPDIFRLLNVHIAVHPFIENNQ